MSIEKPRFSQVGFEVDDSDVEEVEVEQTPKRKVHGRTPTAFAPKAAGPDVRKLRQRSRR